MHRRGVELPHLFRHGIFRREQSPRFSAPCARRSARLKSRPRARRSRHPLWVLGLGSGAAIPILRRAIRQLLGVVLGGLLVLARLSPARPPHRLARHVAVRTAGISHRFVRRLGDQCLHRLRRAGWNPQRLDRRDARARSRTHPVPATKVLPTPCRPADILGPVSDSRLRPRRGTHLRHSLQPDISIDRRVGHARNFVCPAQQNHPAVSSPFNRLTANLHPT